jgi:hypothetical protein
MLTPLEFQNLKGIVAQQRLDFAPPANHPLPTHVSRTHLIRRANAR